MKSVRLLVRRGCKEAWRFRRVADESERPSPKGRRFDGEAFSAYRSEVGDADSPVDGKVALGIRGVAAISGTNVRRHEKGPTRRQSQHAYRSCLVLCHVIRK